MSILDKIIDWTDGLPNWQRDALRRFLTQESLSELDYNEILGLLKATYGLSDPDDPAPEARPVTRKDFGVPTPGGPVVTLLRMSGLKNVNALESGQILDFAEEGITVIYGENAAGKSGYARVLKKACRSRDEAEKVLSNVFLPSGKIGKLEATFDIAVEGEETSETWILGQPPPEHLQEIAVFDTRCARLFVDDTNEVTYMPYGIDVFTKLASLCVDLKTRLEAQRPTLEEIPGELSEIDPDTTVGKLIGEFSRETSLKKVETLASLSAVEIKRLTELAETIKTKEPIKEAEKLRRFKSRAENLRRLIVGLDGALSDKRLAVLQSQQQASQAAEQAAKIASKTTFQEEPLVGVGSDDWRELFKAAERYSQIVSYPEKEFPFTDEGSRCVLCQQILSSEARVRLRRFYNFIKEDTQKKAEEKRSLFEKSCDQFKNLNIRPEGGDPELVDEIGEYESKTKTVLKSYLASLGPRAKAVQEAFQTGDWGSIPPLSPTPEKGLAKIVLNLETKATEFEKAASSKERVGLEAELRKLESRSLLARHKASVLRIIKQLDTLYRLDMCIRATDTTHITRKQTRLMEEAATDALKRNLQQELEALKVGHIKLEMNTTGRRGTTRYQLQLPDSSIDDVNLSEVLSEGEHRAVAIASFMAELQVSGYQCGIIFDDPVSSFDHVRRHRLALRLVNEGKVRQVIIFTHDIVFFLAIIDEATRERVPVKGQTISRFGDKIGLCDSEVPWETKQVNRRKQRLWEMVQQAESYEQEARHIEYNRIVAEFYDRLRATWERAVEENVFCSTVLRYRHDVQTLRMNRVVFEDEDFERIHRGMTRCSEVTLAHDRAAAADHRLSDTTAMKQDLQDLEGFITNLRERQRAAKERRETLLRPPQ